MNATRRSALALVTTLALLAVACASTTTAESPPTTTGQAPAPGGSPTGRPTPVVLPDAFTSVLVGPVAPTVAPVRGSDGRYHVVYELQLTNAKAVPATVEGIDVLDAADQSRVVQSLTGAELAASLFLLSARPAADAALAPMESKLVNIQLSFAEASQVPAALVHRFTGTGASSPAAREAQPLSYVVAPVTLDGFQVPVLAPPLRGDNWVAANGCCPTTGPHRGSVQTINGKLVNAQRFAIDWMKLDAQGRFVNGDPTVVTNWVGYGQPILSATGGVVTSVANDLPDQAPGSLPDPSTITVQTVDGNHVVVDMGNGLSVFYAHMVKGSVQVKVGDRVAAGQQLGQLGNSGNTSAPHLHIHVMQGASVIGSNGVPMVFDAFTLQGGLDPVQFDAAPDQTGTWFDPATARPANRTDELPLNLDVVTWPKG